MALLNKQVQVKRYNFIMVEIHMELTTSDLFIWMMKWHRWVQLSLWSVTHCDWMRLLQGIFTCEYSYLDRNLSELWMATVCQFVHSIRTTHFVGMLFNSKAVAPWEIIYIIYGKRSLVMTSFNGSGEVLALKSVGWLHVTGPYGLSHGAMPLLAPDTIWAE